jgi:hypothetical protein
MSYAILQKELVVPDVECLKRAFSVWPALTSIDAQTSANDAYGILLRGLDVENAGVLKDALHKENVETVVVEESKLPSLPPGRIGRQAEIDSAHLTLYDSMRRASRVAWSDIHLIAAGLVRMREGARVRSAHASAETKEEQSGHLMLEIFLRGGQGRFSVDGREFAYDHLGGRVTDDPAVNFVFLVQDLVRNAPHAGLNRGAFAACQKPPELFPYPSKPAFQEELTWMLWRIGQLEAGKGTGT